MRQRLVDPELCSSCYGCHEACPRGAVVIEARRVAVDAALCRDCGACVDECSTGAIDTIRETPLPWSVEEQLGWDCLPPDEYA